MTTIRPLDTAVEAMTDLLVRGECLASATTRTHPTWGYAVPAGHACYLPLDGEAVDRVIEFIRAHRAVLAQSDYYLRLARRGPGFDVCVVVVVPDGSTNRPINAYDLPDDHGCRAAWSPAAA